MIYEELLAKIDKRHWKLFNYNYQDQTLEGIEFRKTVQSNTEALRAVVELAFSKNEKVQFWTEEAQIGYGIAIKWMIQAIEKELG